MRHVLRLLLAVATLAVSAAIATPASAQAALSETVARAEQSGFAGVIVASDGDEITFSAAIGSADRAADRSHALGEIWPWASVTKQVTAILVMQEVERGRLSLDATLAEALPGFEGANAGVITVRQLLQHTSGLPNPDTSAPGTDGAPSFYLRTAPARARTDALGYCAGAPAAAPGERFDYNNCDYIVLGAILERINGRSYARIINDRIARPLGLRSLRVAPRRRSADRDVVGYVGASPAPPLNEATFGAGGALFGTAADLATLDRALMRGDLLSQASRDVLWAGDPALGYVALGAWSFPASLAGCDGSVALVERRGQIGGVQVRNIIAPALNRSLVVFTNSADVEFGEIWQGAGLTFDLASGAFCGSSAP